MKSLKPIIITGFMASGKSMVTGALARILNREAVDLDQVITGQEGRTPKEIIEQNGEAAFRETETRVLRDVLKNRSAAVIALGGGAWTVQRNRDLIAEHDGFTVWLDAPFELCWQRIAAAGGERPLARDEAQARTLYEERRRVYQLAKLHVAGEDLKNVDKLASDIAEALRT